MNGILTDQQNEVLTRERTALRELQAILGRCEAGREDLATLEQSIRQLDELFLLVIVGEFNAGKSTFINAIVGRALLPEGVTSTTTRIHRLQFGADESREVQNGGLEQITAPVDLLRQVTLVDTPGTNALDREHEAITDQFVPKADLVLFVTSADRPQIGSQ